MATGNPDLDGMILAARRIVAGQEMHIPLRTLVMAMAQTVVHLADLHLPPPAKILPRLVSSDGKGGLQP